MSGNSSWFCAAGILAFPLPISNTPYCDPGYYCPYISPGNNLTYPQICPPTINCQLERLGSKYCDAQGVFEPVLCLPGNYCPDFTTMIECPAGTYCIRGSYAPTDCPPLSYCPAGSKMKFDYGGILSTAVIDIIMIAVYLAMRFKCEPAMARKRAAARKRRFGQGGRTQSSNALASPRSGGGDGLTTGGSTGRTGRSSTTGGGGAGSRRSLGAGMASAIAALPATIIRSVTDDGTGYTRADDDEEEGGDLSSGGGMLMQQYTPPGTGTTGAASTATQPGASPGASGYGGFARPDRKLSTPYATGGEEGDGDDDGTGTGAGGGGSSRQRSGFGGASPRPGASASGGLGNPEFIDARGVLEAGFRKCNAGLHLDLEFKDMGLTLPPPTNKTILSGVSGRIRPGRVTAVMGPSGAGKTTFMNVLMGKVGRTSGELFINGSRDEMHRYRKVIGYVPQDDTMIRELTVRENILFSARVRLPRVGWSAADIERYVDAVIEVLGLSICADTIVGEDGGSSSERISGGQRKRVNIGMELAVAPAAIFLDEPTSGLDSSAALEVCNTLRAIADLGLTVVAVIHQPRQEIAAQFDDLLLLTPGGVTAYIGPRAGAIPYFTSLGYEFTVGNNPADLLLDFVAGRDFERVQETAGGAGLSLTHGSGSGSYADLSRTYDASEFAAAGGEASFKPAGSSGSSSGGAGLDSSQQSTALLEATTSATAAAAAFNELPEHSRFLAIMWRRRTAEMAAKGTIGGIATAGAGGATGGRLADVLTRGGGSSAASSDRPFVFQLSSLNAAPLEGTEASAVTVAGGKPSFNLEAISSVRGASFLYQVYLVHNRSVKQQYRRVGGYLLEMGVTMLAGGMMGAAASQLDSLYQGILKPPYTLISPAPMETMLPSLGFYVSLAVGIAGSPAGVLTFGEEKHVYYREVAAGHNSLAYYIGKSLSVLYRFTLGSLHFAAIFMLLAKPLSKFEILYALVWIQFFAVYGLAAIMSMLVKRENAALLAVIMSLIAGCLCGFGPSLNQFNDWYLGWIPGMSYARWAVEGWFHAETLPYRDHYMVTEISAPLFGYTLDRFALDIGTTVALGVAYRIVAYLLLILLNRSKQR